MKYVLVTGGVLSGLGKGVTASSIGLILKACGLRVTSIKIGLPSPPFLYAYYVVFLFLFFYFDIFKLEFCVIMLMIHHDFSLCVFVVVFVMLIIFYCIRFIRVRI